MKSLLAMGKDAIEGYMIKTDPPIESDCWLHPSLVTMATYILHTCPIHSRYVRRGLGEHRVKPAKEFFVSRKQVKEKLIVSCVCGYHSFFDFLQLKNSTFVNKVKPLFKTMRVALLIELIEISKLIR